MGTNRSDGSNSSSSSFVPDVSKGILGNKATELVDLLKTGIVGSSGPCAAVFSENTWAFIAALTLPVIAVLYFFHRRLNWFVERGRTTQMFILATVLTITATVPSLFVYRHRLLARPDRTGLATEKVSLITEFASCGSTNSDDNLNDLNMLAVLPLICGNDRPTDTIRIEVWVLNPTTKRLIIPSRSFMYNWPSSANTRFFDVSAPGKDTGVATQVYFDKHVITCSDSHDTKFKAKHFQDDADIARGPSVSILGAPIFAPRSTEVVGVLAFTSPGKGVFLPDDERLATYVAAALQSFVAERSRQLGSKPA